MKKTEKAPRKKVTPFDQWWQSVGQSLAEGSSVRTVVMAAHHAGGGNETFETLCSRESFAKAKTVKEFAKIAFLNK